MDEEVKSSEAKKHEEAKKAWDQIADGYDRFVTDTEVWLANEALKRVELEAGQDFLDVAAGCGGLSLPAARLGAKVIATDWSAEMIRLFNERTRQEGLSDATGRVMDGHDLKFADNSFDVAASQFGVMLFPDLPKALGEMVRVTRRGGKVLLIAYGDPSEVEFLGFLISALQTVRPAFQGLPSDPPPLEFQVADPSVMRQRLSQAGLENIHVDIVKENLEFRSGQELWNWILHGNPIVGHVLSALEITDEEKEMVTQELHKRLVDRMNGNGTAILTNPINIGFGNR